MKQAPERVKEEYEDSISQGDLDQDAKIGKVSKFIDRTFSILKVTLLEIMNALRNSLKRIADILPLFHGTETERVLS